MFRLLPRKRAEALRGALDRLLAIDPPAGRIADDPVVFPHRYRDPKDIEVVGLIAAVLAYGQVDLFRRVVAEILDRTGPHPARFCAEAAPSDLKIAFRPLYYRMNRGLDFACLLYFIGEILRRYDSLGTLFAAGYREEEPDIAPALTRFIDRILAIDPAPIYGRTIYPYGLRQMFSSPERRSACKRLNLYLRWMVRPADGLDFGLWEEIPPGKLLIPLDTHVIRISRYLGLTRRRTPGWAMAREITDQLKRLDPLDPLKYDFPLCHLGISGACPIDPDPAKCVLCPLLPHCRKGRKVMGWGKRSALSGQLSA